MKATSIRSRLRHWWRKEIRPLLIMALVMCSIRSSLADWNDVPSGSMEPTILPGDRVFVDKLAYDLKVPFTTWHLAEWSNPQRGDVAVFFSPKDGTRLVKRVIGLPGDTVELRNNVLLINGQEVQYQPFQSESESWVIGAGQMLRVEQLPGHSHVMAATPSLPAARDFGPYRVPADNYFMMGDNRDNSYDSRYFGTVERRRVVGRVPGVVLSLDRQNGWRPRWQRFFHSLDTPIE